jgi:hypothetical protein
MVPLILFNSLGWIFDRKICRVCGIRAVGGGSDDQRFAPRCRRGVVRAFSMSPSLLGWSLCCILSRALGFLGRRRIMRKSSSHGRIALHNPFPRRPPYTLAADIATTTTGGRTPLYVMFPSHSLHGMSRLECWSTAQPEYLPLPIGIHAQTKGRQQ